jgi:hypothetical protein
MTYTFSSNKLGAIDVTQVTTTAPGIAILPSTGYEPQLGEICTGWDPTLGSAEFIYLKIPASSPVTAGNVVTWTAGYTMALLPVLATSKNTGDWVGVAPVTLATNTAVQYGWFQIQGQVAVLKTAVTVSPNVVVYASATAGRIKVLTSAGGQITNMKTFNATTVTSTTSTVLCFLNRPSMQGQIT